ncbi:MAG: GNAT family N-acetyltransferase, partial [Planctomycetota bacterium]
NAREDEPIGWSIGVEQNGYIEVEEFFVAPKYRRQGFGRRLAEMLQSAATVLNLKLKFWIPFADYDIENRVGLEKILASLGLALADTTTPWCAYTTVPRAKRSQRLKPVLLPPRPKGRHGGSESAAEFRERALNMANYVLDEYAELYERLS